MPMKRRVIGIRETVRLDRRGELERWVVVEYTLDDFGPFIFEQEKKEFSFENVKKDMKIQEEGLASLG